jgi:hypothetical protein
MRYRGNVRLSHKKNARDPGYINPNLDPGGKKAPDLGSGSATLI